MTSVELSLEQYLLPWRSLSLSPIVKNPCAIRDSNPSPQLSTSLMSETGDRHTRFVNDTQAALLARLTH